MAEFLTTSLIRAAFIEVCCGTSCSIRMNGRGDGVFVFTKCAEIEMAARSFELDGAVPAKRYSGAIRELRERISVLRQGEKSRGDGKIASTVKQADR